MRDDHITDMYVEHGDIAIAARDHGGIGPDLMLIHGLGGTLDDWTPLTPHLAGFRLVSMDLRGHGHSDDAEWDLDAVLADLHAVAKRCGLDRPAIVGHSLGGRNYRGMSDDRRDEALAELAAMFDAQSAAMAAPLPDAAVAVMSPRAVRVRDDRAYLRVSAATVEAVRRSDWFVDCLPVVAKVDVPFLLVSAAHDLAGVPDHLKELTAAHRAGVREDVAKLAARRTNLVTAEFDAGHGMVTQAPQEVARLVGDFLR